MATYECEFCDTDEPLCDQPANRVRVQGFWAFLCPKHQRVEEG